MLLWIVMAALTAAAALALLVPLYRGRRALVGEDEAEVAIYKDQLAEVERDLGRGLIGRPEAAAARTEIARRLIKADAAADSAPRTSPGRRKVAAVAAVAGLPIAALGLYLVLGSPNLPDQPLIGRFTGPVEEQSLPALMARIEKHLAEKPDDGRGWELVAPIYLRIGRFADAAQAFRNAIRLLGDNAEREAGLGEALVAGGGDVVTDEAKTAFQRAHDLDPSAAKPRFYLAVALSQEGKTADAIAAWQALIKDSPAGAPWLAAAQSQLAQLQGAAPAAGPTQDQVDAAADLTAEQRGAMIAGMVDRLTSRLAANPDDAPGWAQLIRSYAVLGRSADAAKALTDARTALAGKSEQLATVEAEARAAGVAAQ
jgi:cytochrome c-type biogenesis protein CcmH